MPLYNTGLVLFESDGHTFMSYHGEESFEPWRISDTVFCVGVYYTPVAPSLLGTLYALTDLQTNLSQCFPLRSVLPMKSHTAIQVS